MSDYSDYELYLLINGASKHQGAQPGLFQEINPGVGLEIKKIIDNTVTSFMLGQYQNSYGATSNYLGVNKARRFGNDNFHADLGLTAGLVTGYGGITNGMPIAPLVTPYMGVGTKYFELQTRYLPAIGEDTYPVYMFNFSYRIR